MAAFEVSGLPRISNLSKEISLLKFNILGHPATSKAPMSAPKCRICKFDPAFDAPGSGLSSALRISAVRHTYDRMVSFLWTLGKNSHFVNVWNVTYLFVFSTPKFHCGRVAKSLFQDSERPRVTFHVLRKVFPGQSLRLRVHSWTEKKDASISQLLEEMRLCPNHFLPQYNPYSRHSLLLCALRPFRKSVETLRTCPEVPPTVSDNFSSVFSRILASSNDRILSFSLLPLQNSRDRLQEVGFQSLTHRSTRQGLYFSAHFELISYDTFENLWFAFLEIESKLCPQNAWVRIVPQTQGSENSVRDLGLLIMETFSATLRFYSLL